MCVMLMSGHIPENWICTVKGKEAGSGEETLKGKRTEHVQSSAQREGQRSAVLEILRLMEREREFKREGGVWPHSGDPAEPPNGESALKEGYLCLPGPFWPHFISSHPLAMLRPALVLTLHDSWIPALSQTCDPSPCIRLAGLSFER